MGRAKQDTRNPSAIARTWSTQIIATQGLETAYWIAKSAYEQVVAQVQRQVGKHPDEWPAHIKQEVQPTQSEEPVSKKSEIPPPPPIIGT